MNETQKQILNNARAQVLTEIKQSENTIRHFESRLERERDFLVTLRERLSTIEEGMDQ